MATYLLDCDEETARFAWERLARVAPPWTRNNDATPDFALQSFASADSPTGSVLFCSIRFRPTPSTRMMFIILYIVLVFLSWIMIEHIDDFAFFVDDKPVLVELLLIIMFMCLLAFCAVLGTAVWWPTMYDDHENWILSELANSGIDAKPLTPRRYWLLFPGDAVLAVAIEVGVIWSQFASWFGGRNILSLLDILAPLLLVAILSGVVREVALNRLERGFYVHAYWRIRAAECYGPAFLFALPLVLYWSLSKMLGLSIVLYEVRYNVGDHPYSVQEAVGRVSGAATTIGEWDYAGIDHFSDFISGVLSVELGQGIPSWGWLSSLITLFFMLWLVTLPWQIARERRVWMTEWEKGPRAGATAMSFPSSSPRLAVAAILLVWLSRVALVLPGFAALVLGLAWITGAATEAVPLRWIAPFVWYEATIGSGTARVLVAAIFAPALLWLALLAWSLARGARYLPMMVVAAMRGPRQRHRVVEQTERLCAELGITPPLLWLDARIAGLPRAVVVLPSPRLRFVRVPAALADELTDNQLTFVLAHELAHLRLHGDRLWLAQAVSVVSLFGPAYLTLLLDYRKMEFEADAVAASVTDCPEEVEELLERLPGIQFRARVSMFSVVEAAGNAGRGLLPKPWSTKLRASRPVREIAATYDFYFGSILWGELHPLPNERAAHLRALARESNLLDVVEV